MRHPHSDFLTGAAPVLSGADATALTACVRRAQQGDLAAQADLVRRYQRRVAGFLHTLIRNPDAIDDVAQLVFIKLVRRIGRLRDPGAFEAWLFTLARSTALDHLRVSRRRLPLVAGDEAAAEVPDPARPDLSREIHEALAAALRQLSPQDQVLVRMVVDGHDYLTISRQEGLTLGAVKARLSRVRPFLRAAVGTATGTRLPDDAAPARPPAPLRLAA